MQAPQLRLRLLLLSNLLCLLGCAETQSNSAPKHIDEAPPPAAEQPPSPTIALKEAPKAQARLSFYSGLDAQLSILHPLAIEDSAAVKLVAYDSANDIASRCSLSKARADEKKRRTQTASSSEQFEQISAEPLKVGLIPTVMSPAMTNQLIEKTRIWHIDSANLDFYKILSNGRPEGLRPDTPAVACVRYSMIENGSNLVSDMIFSVTYSPKAPEILSVAPVRLYYRDFATLSNQSGAREAAIKVGLNLKTYSLERNSARLTSSLQNQEMAVEIVPNRGTDDAIYQVYSPSSGVSIPVPLPPWDYFASSDNPRHNLSIFGLTVVEIPDFDWLQSEIHHLWPSWEYSATDVSKIKFAAQFYGGTHMDISRPAQ